MSTYPPGLAVVTVTGQVLGDAPTVTFACGRALIGPTDNAVLMPFVVAAVLDAVGSFTVELPATDDPQWTPSGWAYVVRITSGNKTLVRNLTVPFDGGTFDIADRLTAGDPPDPATDYVPLALRGAPGGVASLDEDGLVPVSQLPESSGGSGPAVTWSTLTGKPSTFPPSTHSHTFTEITGKPSTYPPETHAHDYSPSNHTHTYASITGKPTTFPPADHGHVIADVNGLSEALTGKAAAADLTSLTDRVSDVEGMTPVIYRWSGSAYVEAATARVYVGGPDPGAVPDGSVWIPAP